MIRNCIRLTLSNPTSKLFFLIILLSVLSFNHAFSFHLFTDDWYQILGVLYFPEIINGIYLQIHPINALEFKLFAPFFKFNPYPWQFIGFMLKVIAAFSMWPLIVALTGLKKAALYACLIFSVTVIGIESVIWPSAHSSFIVIPLINLGFYLWIRSGKTGSKSNFFYSLTLFFLSILAEPGRAFIVGLLIPFWEILSLYQKLSLKNIFSSVLRLFLFLLCILLSFVLVQFFFQTLSHSGSLLSALLSINFNSLVLSIMNPIFGWTMLPREFIYWLTLAFLITNPIIFILFLWKKQDIYKILIFLSAWIILFYFPNMTQNFARTGLAMDSRYYALSAVGIVGLLAYGFSFLRTKYINWIIFLFLVFNLYVTNSVLSKYSTSRSAQIHNKIWDKIDQDVPKGEIGSVFIFNGVDFSLRTSLLDYKDTIPFAVKRGIIKKENFPIMTSNKQLIARLICEKNVSRHSPFGDIVQNEQILLSNVHAWELKGNELENRSDQERDSIKRIAKCLQY